MIRINNILCPIDFFPASRRAFDYALKLAADNKAKVHALHVVSPVLPAAYDFPVNVSELILAMEKESKRQMIKLRRKAVSAGVDIQTTVCVGDIDAEILAALKKDRSDLIVMGTHGRRGIKGWFIGSVTQRIMRQSTAPVLTIPPAAAGRSRKTNIRKAA